VTATFSVICSALFSFLAASFSYKKHLRQYALSAMRHLGVVFRNTNEICERIQDKINQLGKSEDELDKRVIIGMLENIDVMTSSLKSHIELGESNWQGIFEDEFKIIQKLERERQELQEQIRNLENQLGKLETKKEADQKEKENARKEIDRLKQELQNTQSQLQSARWDMFPMATTVSTLTSLFTTDAVITETCERCMINLVGVEGGKCMGCNRNVCSNCIASKKPSIVSITGEYNIICKDCAEVQSITTNG